MIIESSLFNTCYKPGKTFDWSIDTDKEDILLQWEWLTSLGWRRIAKRVSFIEINQASDPVMLVEEIANESNW